MRSRAWSITIVVAVLAGASGLAAVPAAGQLLSPGRLASAHTELEGIRRCTECHELGTRGIAPERCLSCHVALAERVARGEGYHAAVPQGTCAGCHPDHLGEDFDMVRLDEAAFAHDSTGYALVRSHAEVSCRDCHVPAYVVDARVRELATDPGRLQRTFLGLSTTCDVCHGSESSHGDQFGSRGCGDCHRESVWTEAPLFDHDASGFRLDGLHVDVACEECHGAVEPVVYRPLASGSCVDCHDDPHGGSMGGACASCHHTGGWQQLAEGAIDAGFDHARTGFELFGGHASAECAACHRQGSPLRSELVSMRYQAGTASRSYPRPVAEDCFSCHVDRHAHPDAGGRWSECAACHSESAWAPSTYTLARHAEGASFPLTGSHVATPCFGCHDDPEAGHARFTLALGTPGCEACHASESPHGDDYTGFTCDACHSTDAFEDAGFVHDEPTLAGRSCAGCHDEDDPHAGQFADRGCDACHGTDTFTLEAFDHGATRFPLDGAHEDAACAGCHLVEDVGGTPAVRYRPVGTECTDCHAGER